MDTSETVTSRIRLSGKSFFDTLAGACLVGLTFLLPLFFIPSSSFPFQLTKFVLLALAVLVALTFFIGGRLKERALSVPLNPLLLGVWLLPLAYLLSSLFSSNAGLAFVGYGFVVDSFWFVALCALLLTLVAFVIRSKEDILLMYLAFLSSFFVLALFQTLRLFAGGEFLTFGIFTDNTANLLGKWNDLAVFFGLVTVLSLVTLIGLRLPSNFRWLLYVALGVSLAFLVIVNFQTVWIVVGLFALCTFIYNFFTSTFKRSTFEGEEAPRSKVSLVSLVVLAVSLVFILGGVTLGERVSTSLGITQLEVRPSWQSTVDIMRATYTDHLVFGSGPMTFAKQWLLHKPVGINETVFWNVDFSSGIGFVPTSLISTGLVGALAWLIFFGLLLYGGVRAMILRPSSDTFLSYLTLSLFLGTVYLWVIAIFYPPSIALLVLAFLFTGLFVASLRYRDEGLQEKLVSFADNPKLGFIVVLLLVFLFLGSIIGMIFVGQKFIANVYFQRAFAAFTIDGNIADAEQNLLRAINLDNEDRYFRLATELNLTRLGEIANRTDVPAEELQILFRNALGAAISSGLRATELGPGNYQNFVALGRVYQAVVPLRTDGAYEASKAEYEKAVLLYPDGPLLQLELAQLELAQGNRTAARAFVDSALEKKPNYTEAIFLLSQMQIDAGEIDEAIRSVESAVLINQDNPVAFFQLGLLYYSKENYTKAIEVLEKAVALNNNYSNARYFLGLSYDREDRTPDAITQFEQVVALNPGNTEVEGILVNLKAGRAPFANLVPPVKEDIEDREGLPIEGE